MNAKELKELMERGMAAINKKAVLSLLTRLYFQVDKNGTIKLWGTDMEHWAEVRSDSAYQTSPGIVGIDIEDIKIISKMAGEITLEDVTTESMEVGKINIKCGKKMVTIPRYANTDIFLPTMDETEKKIISVKENWLLETITNLVLFTDDNFYNKMMSVFNFNTKAKRIEALEGHKIGMRTLENQTIYERTENPFETVKLHNMCVPVFKKLMDKKSEKEVIIYQDNKYIRIEGNDFTYVIRRIDGEYYNVDKILSIPEDYRFIPDKEEILEAMTYDADLIKTSKVDGKDKKPVVLHSENGKLYSYIHVSKYEAFDEIETEQNNMNENFYVGFDPKYLTEIFNVVDSEKPVCIGGNAKSPMIITGNEYSFLVLPVIITEGINNYCKIFKNRIKGEAA